MHYRISFLNEVSITVGVSTLAATRLPRPSNCITITTLRFFFAIHRGFRLAWFPHLSLWRSFIGMCLLHVDKTHSRRNDWMTSVFSVCATPISSHSRNYRISAESNSMGEDCAKLVDRPFERELCNQCCENSMACCVINF
jgi:hypothetical protein